MTDVVSQRECFLADGTPKRDFGSRMAAEEGWAATPTPWAFAVYSCAAGHWHIGHRRAR
jgi:hypothetical protein